MDTKRYLCQHLRTLLLYFFSSQCKWFAFLLVSLMLCNLFHLCLHSEPSGLLYYYGIVLFVGLLPHCSFFILDRETPHAYILWSIYFNIFSYS